MTDCNGPDERRLVMRHYKNGDSEGVLLFDLALIPKRHSGFEGYGYAVACLFRAIDIAGKPVPTKHQKDWALYIRSPRFPGKAFDLMGAGWMNAPLAEYYDSEMVEATTCMYMLALLKQYELWRP